MIHPILRITLAACGLCTLASSYIKPYRTVNLRAAWTAPRESWLRGTQFSAGVDDVFDEDMALVNDPPVGFHYSAVARPQQRFWRVAVKRTW